MNASASAYTRAFKVPASETQPTPHEAMAQLQMMYRHNQRVRLDVWEPDHYWPENEQPAVSSRLRVGVVGRVLGSKVGALSGQKEYLIKWDTIGGNVWTPQQWLSQA